MNNDLSIVIPAYNRVKELQELLDSILNMNLFPKEVIICEDNSSDRNKIINIVEHYHFLFKKNDIFLNLILNEVNLGYDRNLRKCIESSSSSWAMILGNDDLVLPNAVIDFNIFIKNFGPFDVISRTFIRFDNDIFNPIGISRLSNLDTHFSRENSNPKMLFRSSAFIGGLIVNVEFSLRHSTDKYDGSLYYQVYLAAIAYSNQGIGYISNPIVGGRTGNPPMFGSGDSVGSDVHLSGTYTPKGRASMWKGVLSICKDVGDIYDVDLLASIHHELSVRQSFHIFEMNCHSDNKILDELVVELKSLGLFEHPFPKILYFNNKYMGRYASILYKIVRKIYQ